MKQRLQAVLVAFEAVPFAKVGGLADVAGALPDALAEQDVDCRLVIPMFGQIDPQEHGLERVPVPADWSVGIRFDRWPFEVWRGRLAGGAEVWLIGGDRHFGRRGIYADDDGRPFADELERYVFFAKGALEMMKCFEWRPDVINVNDYQTAPIAAWVRETYRDEPAFRDAAVVHSIHNLGYQGRYAPEDIATLGFPRERFEIAGPFECHGTLNLMKLGIVYADRVSTVSPTYAREILEPEHGAGLDGVLRANASKLRGILNGIDTRVWDPAGDRWIDYPFDRKRMHGKRGCKGALLARAGISLDRIDRPLLAAVGRLVDQKGVDLILEILESLLDADASFVILGSGERRHEDALREICGRRSDRARAFIGFDEGLAHLITAGADAFLMPSRYEPCGLNQMYSLRYGTVPIVRRTGGLADTVEEWNHVEETGTGFLFDDAAAPAFAAAIDRFLKTHEHPRALAALRRNGMSRDFSWTRSAAEYRDLYEEAIAARRGRG